MGRAPAFKPVQHSQHICWLVRETCGELHEQHTSDVGALLLDRSVAHTCLVQQALGSDPTPSDGLWQAVQSCQASLCCLCVSLRNIVAKGDLAFGW
jgi:hypothetical protein